jgi:hypothetical protein
LVVLYSSVPSVTSTTSPSGVLTSSGIAKWLVMACVSTASRRVRNQESNEESQTDLFHSIVVVPRCRSRECAGRSVRFVYGSLNARTSSGARWSTCTAIHRPPTSSTREAVSSIVSAASFLIAWNGSFAGDVDGRSGPHLA